MRRSLRRGDLVGPFGAGVLASHDIVAQIDRNRVLPVHPAFLTKGLDRPTALDRGIEFVDPLAEPEGVRVLNQGLEDRPGQAVYNSAGSNRPVPVAVATS